MIAGKLRQVLFLIAIAVFITSCAEEDSGDPNIPGSDRDKFTGDWLCKETVPGTPTVTFTISIQKHGSEDTLYVYNFNNIGIPFYAVWSVDDNSVTIPNQTVSQTTITGNGFYDDGEIILNYNSDGEAASAVCTPQ